MTIFAGDKERNLANTVMDWLLNLGYLGLFLGTFLEIGRASCRERV